MKGEVCSVFLRSVDELAAVLDVLLEDDENRKDSEVNVGTL